jgi:hypothetical protein
MPSDNGSQGQEAPDDKAARRVRLSDAIDKASSAVIAKAHEKALMDPDFNPEDEPRPERAPRDYRTEDEARIDTILARLSDRDRKWLHELVAASSPLLGRV